MSFFAKIGNEEKRRDRWENVLILEYIGLPFQLMLMVEVRAF